MSQTIENRVVEMQFENKQFESGVKESLSTLDKLKKALNFKDTEKNLMDFGKQTKNFSLNDIGANVEKVSSKFNAFGTIGFTVMQRLTNSAIDLAGKIGNILTTPMKQIKAGGWKRAMNIEEAKFQLEGLGVEWESVYDNINDAVSGTAFSFDAAAKACAQLSASGVKAGDDMKKALLGISGVAAMGNTEYENIADIFTKAAGNGKVMADELNRISQYGLNARATLKDFYNAIIHNDKEVEDIPEHIKEGVLAVTKGIEVTEADISEFASKSKIDFETFYRAMEKAFGQHALDANETFSGSLRNINAALSRVGQGFAEPLIKNAVPVFNKIREIINAINAKLDPFKNTFRNIVEMVSGKLTDKLGAIKDYIEGNSTAFTRIYLSIQNIITAVLRVSWAFKTAFSEVFGVTDEVGDGLSTITGGIEKFTRMLIPSKETTIMFKNILVSLFSILKSIGTVIKSLLPSISTILSVGARIVAVISNLVAKAINFVSQLDLMKIAMTAIQFVAIAFLAVINKLITGFNYLKNVLSDTSTVTGQVVANIKSAVTTIAFMIGGTLYSAFNKIKDFFTGLFTSGDPLVFLVVKVENLIAKFKELNIIEVVINKIKDAFNGLISIFAPVHGAIDKTTECVKTLVGATEKGEKVIEETFEMTKAYGNGPVLKGVAGELTKTGSTVEDTSNKMTRAQKIFKIFGDTTAWLSEKLHGLKASSVVLAIFAMRLVVMAYNTDQLIFALGGLVRKLKGGFFNFMKSAPSTMAKFTAGLLEITAAVTLIVLAMRALKDIPVDQLKTITLYVGGLIVVMGALSAIFAGVAAWIGRFGGTTGFASFGANLFLLSSSLIIFIGALKLLDSIELKNIKADVIALIVIMTSLAGISALISKFIPKMTVGSLYMVSFAAATLILVKALDNLSGINFDAIKANWKELIAVLLGFAAVAAIASTIGIGSTIGLIAFFVGFINISKVLEVLKTQLKDVDLGNFILDFCSRLKRALEQFFGGLKDLIQQADSVQVAMAALITAMSAIVATSLLRILNGVSRFFGRLALSVLTMAASVSLMMYAIVKMTKAMEQLPAAKIEQAKWIFIAIASLIAVLAGIMAFSGGDKSAYKGLKEVTRTSRSSVAKQVRKMLLDMSILILAIAAFMAIIGKLTPEQCLQAEGILWEIMGFITIMLGIVSLASIQISKGSGVAGFGTFLGIIALFGTMIASFVVLMNYFKDFTWANDWQRFVMVIVVIGSIATAIGILLRTIGKMQFNGAWAIFASLGLAVAAIGGIAYLLIKEVKKNDLKTALVVFGALETFLLTLSAFAGVMIWMSKTTLNNVMIFRGGWIYKSLAALGLAVVAIGGIAALLIRTIKKDELTNAIVVFGALEVFLLTLAGIVYFLNKTGNNIVSAGMEAGATSKIVLIIVSLIAAIAVIGYALYKLKDIDALTNFFNAATIIASLLGLMLVAKAATMLAMTVDAPHLGIAAGIIIAMGVIFAAMSLIFYQIDKFTSQADQIFKKSQTITLVMIELIAIAAILTVAGKAMIELEAGIGALIGAGIMAAMLGFFYWITQIFKSIDEIKLNGLKEKIDILMETMLDLVLLAGIISLVGSILGPLTGFMGAIGAAIGLGAFALMILFFQWISYIFVTINGIKTDGLETKAKAIVQVMLVLVGLSAISIVAVAGLPGLPSMYAMTDIFRVIGDAFVALDAVKTDGMELKAKILVQVLVALIGVATLLGVLAPLVATSVIGANGMMTLAEVMVAIGLALNKVAEMGDLDRMKWVAQNMVELLFILTGLGALNGLGFGFAGQGLEALANGIIALGQAMTTIPAVMDQFSNSLIKLSTAIAIFTATGPVINQWLNDVSTGITDFCSNIIGMIAGFNNSITQEIQSIIQNITSIIFGGKQPIYEASAQAGSGIEEGLTKNTEDSKTWGLHVIENFASGILVGITTALSPALGSVVSTVAAYLKHTEAEKGEWAGGAEKTWGLHTIQNFCEGLWEGIKGPLPAVLNEASSAVRDGLTQMFPELSNIGQQAANYFGFNLEDGIMGLIPGLNIAGLQAGNAVGSGVYDNVDLWCSNAEARIYSVGNALAQLSSSYAKGMGTLSDFEHGLKKRIKESEDSTARLQNAYNRTGRSAEYLDRAIKNSAANTKGLKDQLSDLQNGWKSVDKGTEAFEKLAGGGAGGGGKGGKGGGGIKGATDALDEFQSKLEETLEGQMNIFQKFEKKDPMNKDELLANMRSQIQGMTEWAAQMQTLAAKGLDQGLYQELAMMGPQGAEYVGAFAQMTAEELQQANQLWAQSLVLPKQVAGQVAGAFNGIGQNLMAGEAAGIAAGKGAAITEAVNAQNEITSESKNAVGVQSPSTVFEEIGMFLMKGLVNGIKAHGGEATTQIKKICAEIVSAAQSALSYGRFYSIGVNLINGLTAGLKDKDAIKALKARLQELANMMEGEEKDDNKIKSPSKLWRDEIGRYLVLGLAEGIRAYAYEAVNAVDDLSDTTLNSMKDTISGIGQMLVDEVDDPVIRPVLDLSNVEAGARTLNNMFSTSQALSASASLTDLQNEQSNSPKLGTTFIQNNYSPKALSRTEIYRQTKNQFSAYREAFS